ncbi:MAG: cytochrome d ubiquinol oxidase subunit II [Thiohalocapsa sp.]
MDPSLGLAEFWGAVLALSILIYVLLDGFDLGVGILFGLNRDEDQRRDMMGSIAPVWDGNETWLIIVGTVLFGAFPVVYAIFLSAFYLPVALLLVALILRGVAFEFRYKTHRGRWIWDWGFVGGSAVASFVQGAAIGAMVQGIRVEGHSFAGGPFDWLAPFPLLCGAGLVAGYTLLGASWLVLKTEGALRDWAYRLLPRVMTGVIGFVALALLGTLLGDFRVIDRWLERPELLLLPLLASFAAWGLYAGVRQKRDWQPFVMASLLFLIAYLMLGGSFWPWILPFALTVQQAAAPDASLEFLFYGAGIIVLPIILAYTATVYWVFRGKVKSGATYH